MLSLISISSQGMNTPHVLCIEQLTPCLVHLALAKQLESLSFVPTQFQVSKDVAIFLWGDVSPPVIRSMLMHLPPLHLQGKF